MSKPKKNDHRVRLTKEMLKQALIKLLREKGIQSITVKELCETAGINRGTFYSHYYDIYALLEDIESEILETINNLLDDNSLIYDASEKQTSLFFSALFQFFKGNKELCEILLGEHGDKNFVTKIIDMAKEKTVAEYTGAFPGISTVQAELYYTFVASGFLSVLQYWLSHEDAVSIEKLAWSTEMIIAEGVQFLRHPM